MNQSPYRILLYNTGYGTGLNGSFANYLFSGYRYIRTPKRILQQISEEINAFVARIKPDLCCFLEIRKGALHSALEERFATNDTAVKYSPRSAIGKLPVARTNRNGFFSLQKTNYTKHFLKYGVKKLVYEIQAPEDISLFLVHLSLSRRTRKRQIAEIVRLVRSRPRAILCGDFNITHGLSELAPLLNNELMVLSRDQPQLTFPAHKPTKSFDLFLHSPGISVIQTEAITALQTSDHLPVILEIMR